MRTLRFLTLALALSLTLPLLAAPAFAGSGKAIIPPSHTTYGSTSSYTAIYLYISNITENTIETTITLYDNSGNIVYESSSGQSTGDIRADTVSSYTEATSSADGYTATFKIAAKQTCSLKINAPSGTPRHVFGTIEWKNDSSNDDDEVALVANAMNSYVYIESSRARNSKYSLQINSHMPF